VILAAAGLRRLGMAERISAALDPSEMLPAIGQGALGIETRSDDEESITIARTINHSPSSSACIAERALLRELGGGCQVPIAGHAITDEDNLRLDGLVLSRDGEKEIRGTIDGLASAAERLGESLAESLLAQGAASLLQSSTPAN
jgi:hydroxymethylbilane synthase